MGFFNKLKGAVPTPADFATRDRAMRLHQSGINATGILNALEKTGREDFGGGIEYRFDVTVNPPEGAPYDVTFTQSMMEGMMGAWAQPGGAVRVRILPDDPSQAMMMGGA